MNEDKQKQILEQLLSGFSEQVRKAADEAISEAECRILPYALEDTIANAAYQAEDIVTAIASGEFDRDGDYVCVRHPREFNSRVHIKMSDQKYDSLRDILIASMPECPKDAKIRALEDEIKSIYEWGRI